MYGQIQKSITGSMRTLMRAVKIIALIYGNGDFRKTLHIITMCGVDVDCNAGMIMPLLAIQQGMKAIPPELIIRHFPGWTPI